jgi:hypothetical protein
MKNNYNFSKGVRGKYAIKYKEGTNLVALEPDVQKAFPNSGAVNKALRELIKVARKSIKSGKAAVL